MEIGIAKKNELRVLKYRAMGFFLLFSFFLLGYSRKRKYLSKNWPLSKWRWGFYWTFTFHSEHIFALLGDDYHHLSDIPNPPVSCTLWITKFITCQAWSDTSGQTGTLLQTRHVNCLSSSAYNMLLNVLKSWKHFYCSKKRK